MHKVARAWVRGIVGLKLGRTEGDYDDGFWDWMASNYYTVRNPNPDGRERMISFLTLKGYAFDEVDPSDTHGRRVQEQALRDLETYYERYRREADQENAEFGSGSYDHVETTVGNWGGLQEIVGNLTGRDANEVDEESIKETILDLCGVSNLKPFARTADIQLPAPGVVKVKVEGTCFTMDRRISLLKGIAPESISNDYFKVSGIQRKGFGTAMLAGQLEAADKYNFPEITCYAAGGPDDPDYSGYYVWPRLGFNANLSDWEISTLPNEWKEKLSEFASSLGDDRVQIRHVMMIPELRKWWKEKGGFALYLSMPTGEDSVDTPERKFFSEYHKDWKERIMGKDKKASEAAKGDGSLLSPEEDALLDQLWDKEREESLKRARAKRGEGSKD